MAVEAVLFTSFEQVRNRGWEQDRRVEVWSAARWQPKGFRLAEAAWMKPVWPAEYQKAGQPFKLRDVYGDVGEYHKFMRYVYGRHESVVVDRDAWLAKAGRFVVAACWCPWSKTSQRQIATFGSFVCHTAPLGSVLAELGVRVEYDSDRCDRMVRVAG